MKFLSQEPAVTATEGGIVYLDPLDLAVVDVLVQLHFGAHNQLPQNPVCDQARANLLSQVLLNAGRSLAGWGPQVLAAHAETLRHNPVEAGQAIARHAYEYLRRPIPSEKPTTILPPAPAAPPAAENVDTVIFRASVILGTLTSIDAASLRTAARVPGLRPDYAERILALAAFRETFP